jgi:hypothetical protein
MQEEDIPDYKDSLFFFYLLMIIIFQGCQAAYISFYKAGWIFPDASQL